MKSIDYNRQRLAERVNDLRIPQDSYLIVGSGILHVLGIRKSNDIDLLVTTEVFSDLADRGWTVTTRDDGTSTVGHEDFDCMTDWYDKGLHEMLPEAQYVDGAPYLALSAVYRWKQELGREKDQADLKLIDDYIAAGQM